MSNLPNTNALFTPGSFAQTYCAPRQEWVNCTVVAAGSPSLLRVATYCVKLYNGELLENVPEGRLRPHFHKSKFLQLDASDGLEDESRICFKLASASLDSPPLPPSGFPIPLFEAAHESGTGEALKSHDLKEFRDAAVRASTKMVEAPRQPPKISISNDEKPSMGKYSSRASRPNTKYCVSDVEFVLQPKLLRTWRQRLREVRAGAAAANVPMSCPVFAWHSTPWHGNLNKIVDSGFLAPGDQDVSSGQSLKTSHGAVYGQGVYTTPDIELTNCYGFRDRFGRRQALLCLVNMGHTDILQNAFDPCGAFKFPDTNVPGHSSAMWLDLEIGADFDGQLRPYQALEDVMDEATKEALMKEFGGQFPSTRMLLSAPRRWEPHGYGLWQSAGSKLVHGRKGGAGECFGFNSRISPDRREYVAARSDQVLPVMLVTYEPRRPFDLKTAIPPLIAPKCSPTVRFIPLVDTSVANAPSSTSLKAANGFVGATESEKIWTVDVGEASQNLQCSQKTSNVHIMFVVEKSPEKVDVASNDAACVAIMREFKEVPPNRVGAIYFPSDSKRNDGLSVGHFGEVTSPSSFASIQNKVEPTYPLTSASPLADALCLASELCMRKKQKLVSERHLKAAQFAEKTIALLLDEHTNTKDNNAHYSFSNDFIREIPTSSTVLALGTIPSSESLREKLSLLKKSLRQLPKSQELNDDMIEFDTQFSDDRVFISSSFLPESHFYHGSELLEASMRAGNVLAFGLKLRPGIVIIPDNCESNRTVALEMVPVGDELSTDALHNLRTSIRERFPLCSVNDRLLLPLARFDNVLNAERAFGRYYSDSAGHRFMDAPGAKILDEFFESYIDCDENDTFLVSNISFLAREQIDKKSESTSCWQWRWRAGFEFPKKAWSALPVPPSSRKPRFEAKNTSKKIPAEQWIVHEEIVSTPTANWGIKTDASIHRTYKLTKRTLAKAESNTKDIFVTIVITRSAYRLSGIHGVLSDKEAVDLVKKSAKYCRNMEMASVIKFLPIVEGTTGGLISLPLVLELTRQFQTLEHWAPRHGCYAANVCLGNDSGGNRSSSRDTAVLQAAQCLVKDLSNVLQMTTSKGGVCSVALDERDQTIGCGFVKNLAAPGSFAVGADAPAWNVNVLTASDTQDAGTPMSGSAYAVDGGQVLIFRGRPPSALWVSGELVGVDTCESHAPSEKVKLSLREIEGQLQAVQALASNLRLTAILGRVFSLGSSQPQSNGSATNDVAAQVQILRKLVNKIRSRAMIAEDSESSSTWTPLFRWIERQAFLGTRASSTAADELRALQRLPALHRARAVALARRRAQLLRDLETVANEVDAAVQLSAAWRAADCEVAAHRWLNDLSKEKFAAAALKRVSHAGRGATDAAYSAAAVGQDFREHMEPLRQRCYGEGGQPSELLKDFTSVVETSPGILSGEIGSNAVVAGMSGTARSSEHVSTLSLLYTFGARGVVVKVRRSHASTVNPWVLVVEHVAGGAPSCSTRDALAALDAGMDLAAALRDEPNEVNSEEVTGNISNVHNMTDKNDKKEASKEVSFGAVPGCEDCVVLAGPESVDSSVSSSETPISTCWRPEATAMAFLQSRLHDLYLSTVFTRSTTVPLPAQRVALLAITFCRGVAQLLLCNAKLGGQFLHAPGLRNHARQMVSCWLTLRELLRAQPPSARAKSDGSDRSTSSGSSGGNGNNHPSGGSALVGWAKQLAHVLVHSTAPQDHITEAPTALNERGCASVCQALAVLACTDACMPLFVDESGHASATSSGSPTPGASRAPPAAPPLPARPHPPSPQLVRVAMALLAEAVSRGCRVQVKAQQPIVGGKKSSATTAAAAASSKTAISKSHEPPSYRPLLRKALGIKLSSCHAAAPLEEPEPPSTGPNALVHDDSVDLAAGARASSAFFGQTYTNCTPWAIVATVGFTDVVWHQLHAMLATKSEEPASEEAPPSDTRLATHVQEPSAAPPQGLQASHSDDLQRVIENAFEGPNAAGMRETLVDAVVSAFDQQKGNEHNVSMRRFARRFFPMAAAAAAGPASAPDTTGKEQAAAGSHGDGSTSGKSKINEEQNSADAVPKPMEVQVALYAQGLRYHSSHARRNDNTTSSSTNGGGSSSSSTTTNSGGSSSSSSSTNSGGSSSSSSSNESVDKSGSRSKSDALGLAGLGRAGDVLRALAAEERQKVYEDRVALKRQALRAREEDAAAAGRQARLSAESLTFGATHRLPNLPRLFSPFELDEMNRARPANDQLEVHPAGLLRHHCAFPRCPQYLQNLATKKDQLLGTRRGLFRHLKYYVVPERNYWPNLHAACAAAYRKTTMAAKTAARNSDLSASEAIREAYTARVLLSYPDDHRGRQYGSRTRLLAFVDALFEQFSEGIVSGPT